jgi:integrase
MLGCGLRHEETAALKLDPMQQRDGRWVIVDLIGKGARVRSVPMPSWAKAALDVWVGAAVIPCGHFFRTVNKGDRACGDGMTAQAVFNTIKAYAVAIGLDDVAPHDLRRSYAKLAHKGRASRDRSGARRTLAVAGSGAALCTALTAACGLRALIPLTLLRSRPGQQSRRKSRHHGRWRAFRDAQSLTPRREV